MGDSHDEDAIRVHEDTSQHASDVSTARADRERRRAAWGNRLGILAVIVWLASGAQWLWQKEWPQWFWQAHPTIAVAGVFFVAAFVVGAVVEYWYSTRRTADVSASDALVRDGERACPYCAETIRAAAIVCRFCGYELVEDRSAGGGMVRVLGIAIGAILLVLAVGPAPAIIIVLVMIFGLRRPRSTVAPRRLRTPEGDDDRNPEVRSRRALLSLLTVVALGCPSPSHVAPVPVTDTHVASATDADVAIDPLCGRDRAALETALEAALRAGSTVVTTTCVVSPPAVATGATIVCRVQGDDVDQYGSGEVVLHPTTHEPCVVEVLDRKRRPLWPARGKARFAEIGEPRVYDAKRWEADETAARKRTEAERERQEKAAIATEQAARRTAIAKQLPTILRGLDEEWGRLRGVPKTQFLSALSAHSTALGTPLLHDAEIREERGEQRLHLWAASNAVIWANTRLWADFAEAFVVWCQCDGRTGVGLDYSHVGGPQGFFMVFELKPETGRIELAR